MSVTSGFFNSLNHDRKYNAEQMSAIFNGIINDGVFANIGTAFAVSAAGGRDVTIGIGRAWFNGIWLLNDAPLVLSVDSADLLLNRYDAVVIEIDKTDPVREGSIKIVKGTPSSAATYPTMTHAEDVDQYPLAYIYSAAASTTVSQADITNKIGTSDCPYITGILQVQNIDAIVAQWQAEFDDWSDEIRDMITDLAEAIEQAKQLEIVDGAVTYPKLADDVKAKLANPNLLDNGWFMVNQRGATSWTSGYGVDRWTNNGNANIQVVDDGVKLLSGALLTQKIEKSRIKEGILTLSIKADGAVYSTRISAFSGSVMCGEFPVELSNTDDIVTISIGSSASNDAVNAVKLEYGSVSTLANDHAPDYATELLKCQRYFYRPLTASIGLAHQGQWGAAAPVLPAMRTMPAASNLIVRTSNGAVLSDANIYYDGVSTPNGMWGAHSPSGSLASQFFIMADYSADL